LLKNLMATADNEINIWARQTARTPSDPFGTTSPAYAVEEKD